MSKMKTETYFLVALILAVVALLSFAMRANPLYMALNTDSFPIYYIWPQGPTIEMYFTSLTMFIFIPTVYFSIGFCVAGITKIIFQQFQTSKKKRPK